MKRVVVTGMGAITPIGNSVEEFWNGIKEQKIGFAPITYFDATEYKAHLAAEVKGFNAKDYMSPKAARRMELFSQYAVAATKEAIEDAGLDLEKEDTTRIGVSVGCGVGSLQMIETTTRTLDKKGPNRVKPLAVPMMISNMAAGNVSIAFGLRGKSINVVTACATGTQSIGEAYRSIQVGEADVMVAGGTEAAVSEVAVGGFAALTALSGSDDPKRASIPFDKERDGFVIGEGSGIVVLESLEHAQARGANILAEVVGYGATSDAFHITSPCEDGEGAQPRGGVGGGAGAVGSSSEQEGVGDDGEGGERVRGAAEEARDHREGQEPDREGDRGAGREEGDAGDDVREGEPRLRVDLLDAVAGRVGAFGAEQRERVGGFGGARGVRREGEGVVVGAERGSAQSVGTVAGVVAGVVAAAVQARADVHPGRGGRGAR